MSDALTAWATRVDRRARRVPETPIGFDEVLYHLHAIATADNVAKAVKQLEAFWWANVNDGRVPESGEQWELVSDFVDDLHLFEPRAERRESGMFGEDEARSRVIELLKRLGDPAAT